MYDLYKKSYNLAGHIADVGTWKGASFLFLAKLVRLFESYNNTQVHGFDWFEGMKPQEGDCQEVQGEYLAEYETLLQLIDLQNLNNIAILHKMDIINELSSFFKENPYLRFKMVFVDCGITDVLEKSLENFWPKIVQGGVLIMDHYNVETSPTESDIVDKYIGKNCIKQYSFNRQPTAYIIKER